MGGSYVVARVHSQWGVHPLGVARVAELFGCVVRARVDSGTCLGACVWNVVHIYRHMKEYCLQSQFVKYLPCVEAWGVCFFCLFIAL